MSDTKIYIMSNKKEANLSNFKNLDKDNLNELKHFIQSSDKKVSSKVDNSFTLEKNIKNKNSSSSKVIWIIKIKRINEKGNHFEKKINGLNRIFDFLNSNVKIKVKLQSPKKQRLYKSDTHLTSNDNNHNQKIKKKLVFPSHPSKKKNISMFSSEMKKAVIMNSTLNKISSPVKHVMNKKEHSGIKQNLEKTFFDISTNLQPSQRLKFEDNDVNNFEIYQDVIEESQMMNMNIINEIPYYKDNTFDTFQSLYKNGHENSESSDDKSKITEDYIKSIKEYFEIESLKKDNCKKLKEEYTSIIKSSLINKSEENKNKIVNDWDKPCSLKYSDVYNNNLISILDDKFTEKQRTNDSIHNLYICNPKKYKTKNDVENKQTKKLKDLSYLKLHDNKYNSLILILIIVFLLGINNLI